MWSSETSPKTRKRLGGPSVVNATVYEVQGQLQGRSYLASLDHFDLRRVSEMPAEALLGTPPLTPYAFDDDER